MMPTTIFYITKEGYLLSKKIKYLYKEATIVKYKRDIVKQHWNEKGLLIFIMASGIVVRAIAPLLTCKRIDPAILVVDEKGSFVISLLSGHLGGANEYARKLAEYLGAQPVITTASDINKLPAIDLWAKENSLEIENWDLLPSISTKFLNKKKLKIYSEINLCLPSEFIKTTDPKNADLVISNKIAILNNFSRSDLIKSKDKFSQDKLLRTSFGEKEKRKQLILRPKNLVVGIGLNSNTESQEIEKTLKELFRENNLSILSIHCFATLDKKAYERGLLDLAKKYSLEIRSFSPEEINKVENIETSERVFQATGAKAVAEPCAILASKGGNLLIKKQKRGNVTLSIAEIAF
ncbi:MAG: cobalamin biosynthesis protein [Thermodesulfovibrionales bacterium]|nr:cobalamin biosynthesis protein [Thermodesulfovibrionales bacterium]